MDLSQLPTDNLYKFMALAGVVLILASFIPSIHSYQLGIELCRIDGDLSILEEENKWLDSDVNSLKNDAERLEQEVDRHTQESARIIDSASEDLKPNDREALEKILKDNTNMIEERLAIEDKLKEIVEKHRQHVASRIRVNAKTKEHKHICKAISFEYYVGLFAFAGGLIMTFVGFKLWYRKLQVFQDKIIEAEVEETKAKGKTTPKKKESNGGRRGVRVPG
ncbi:MAG: hypothetical protein JXM79_13930 [Sedimentisphaerales bacterium]|nr:hypothetical protein [Sedimentisphaerales bacterium]